VSSVNFSEAAEKVIRRKTRLFQQAASRGDVSAGD
jgi:hypothetical protein